MGVCGLRRCTHFIVACPPHFIVLISAFHESAHGRGPLVEMLAILSSAASGFVAQPRGAAFAASRAAAVRHAGACLDASDKFYSFSAKELVSNADAPLSQYEGQVSLVVNVASK